MLEQTLDTQNPELLGGLAFVAAEADSAEVDRTGVSLLAVYDGDTGELVFVSAQVEREAAH